MKIIAIGVKGVRSVKTTIHEGRNGHKFHNVKHGHYEKGFWAYTLGVSSKVLRVEDSPNSTELVADDYTLLPIDKNGKQLKDGHGNLMYFIGSNTLEDHIDDFIVLWNIPNNHYVNVKYEISKNVVEIGSGSIGRKRGDVKYSSPAPILEVTGPASLRWSGDDLEGNQVSQVIKFDGKKWDVGDLTFGKK